MPENEELLSEEAKWYVIHTYSGYENKVMTDLETTVKNRDLGKLIQEVRIPTETVVESSDSDDSDAADHFDPAENGKSKSKKEKKTKEVKRKIYPGYVFVKMIKTDETWYVVRNIRGCTGFVGSTTEPFPLTEEEVERLGVETRTVEIDFAVGDTVRIYGVGFENATGVVKKIDTENERAVVTIHFLGRETSAEVSFDQIEPMD